MQWVNNRLALSPWQGKDQAKLDWVLVGSMIVLACIGVMMVASASIAIAEKRFNMELRYVLQQLVYLVGSLVLVTLIVRKTSLSWWRRHRLTLLVATMALILLTLFFGREISGAKRWLSLGFFNLQPSEFLKLTIIVFMAAYIEKNFKLQFDGEGNRDKRQEKAQRMGAVWLLMLPLAPISIMLLMQPDFGSFMVVLVLIFVMLLMAGAPLRLLLSLLPIALAAVILIIIEPYRLDRVTSFFNPWADAHNKGYQLTHSLMALGSGGWFGVGLGNSVEKLFYLPDAHTDFLFAIYGEEFGLLGVLFLIALYLLLIWRVFNIGRRAALREDNFSALLCYGVGVWIAVQVFINMGANLGLIPTKGLTLPLVSYGGSSLFSSLLALGLVLRVDWENRQTQWMVKLPEKTGAPLERPAMVSASKLGESA